MTARKQQEATAARSASAGAARLAAGKPNRNDTFDLIVAYGIVNCYDHDEIRNALKFAKGNTDIPTDAVWFYGGVAPDDTVGVITLGDLVQLTPEYVEALKTYAKNKIITSLRTKLVRGL